MIDVFANKARAAKNRFVGLFKPDSLRIKIVPYRGLHIIAPVNIDVGWRLFTERSYEDVELNYVERLVRRDDRIIDIGANIGIYALVLARKASEGHLIAVEPVAFNRRFLGANLSLNSVHNVRVLDSIISDAEGEMDFSVSEDETYSSIVSSGRKRTKETIRLPSTTLDSLFTTERIDFMKIDVEGAEMLVLAGGRELLASPERRPRAALIELNPQNQAAYGHAPEDIIRYMEAFGYEVYSLTPEKLVAGYTPAIGCEDFLFWHAGRAGASIFAALEQSR